ncbi:hypothetical protein [Roseovarius sp. Pro17]|uniref:hypothetical protein n=1 Tax=Roseovarius sp. Pro17 TaxID=3108175 RepID=UPI002D791EC7|nr:hypothetical protein [Roseovarius sp. Pro17]
MASGSLTHPCFFMHVPKCGGTSVAEALYATVPISERVGVIDANATRRATAIIEGGKNEKLLYHDDLATGTSVFELREKLLLMHMAWGTQLIHGHVLFSDMADRHFGSTYKYVTLLRDPVSRLVSNYNGSVAHGLTTVPFKEYLETDIARYHALTALRYFSGQHLIHPGSEGEAVEVALDVAKKFAVIGYLDDLDKFCADFGEVFGRKPRIFHYNKRSEGAYRPDDSELARCRQLLEPEIRFWDTLRSRD